MMSGAGGPRGPTGGELNLLVDEEGAGWRLRAVRAELGLTEEALAGEMRRWADLHGAPRPDITAETVAEWEGGLRPLDRGARRLLWLALEIPSQEWPDLGGQLDVDVWSLFRPSRPAHEHRALRREFLRYVVTLGEPSGLDPERLSAALDETSRVDRRLVENLGFVARQFARRWGNEPVHTVRQHLHAHLQAVHGLLDQPMPREFRRDLETAAAGTAAFAGMVSVLTGHPDDALVYLQLAERLARDAADAEGEALALMFSSHLYSPVCPGGPNGDRLQAQALLEAADRRLGRRTSPVASAWVLMRMAEELAGSGDEPEALRCIDEADRLVSTGHIPEDGLCSRWSLDIHTAYRGNVAVLAGHPERGIPLLEAALAVLRKDAIATRSMATADLGGAYAMQGEVDHACELLAQALMQAVTVGLPEPVKRVRRIHDQQLCAYPTVPAVRRLGEQLQAVP
jgi:transcriptional regulator with XRE-family HTH domain